MAFLTIEDLTGTVEIIVFPKDYERYQRSLNVDEKIFVTGRATVEDEQDGKVICERIVPFDDTKKEVWLQFSTKEAFMQRQQELLGLLRESDGEDEVVIYVANPKAVKRLGRGQAIRASRTMLDTLTNFVGEKNRAISL